MQHRDEATPCPEGEPVLFALSFTNEYSYGEKYYVGIEGLEKGSREFILVSNAVEWEFYCSKHELMQRKRDTMHPRGSTSLMKQPNRCICFLMKP